MKIKDCEKFPLTHQMELRYNFRLLVLNVFKIKDLISFVVSPNIFHKNPTVCIYLITLNNISFLGIPHLLAYLPPLLSQLEVQEQVVIAEVVVSSRHPPGDHVPGGQGGPVVTTENKGVPFTSPQRMTGSDVPFIHPDTSLQLHQSLDHLDISLTSPDSK